MENKITIRDIIKRKNREKIVMITAYDYVFAKLVDKAGVDLILVGDSVGMVVHGLPSTLYVDMNMMKLHVSSVARAKPRALVVADMPFLSYEISVEEALRNAGEFIRLGADAVKIEGGSEYVDVVKNMVRAGIPVMGHIGLNPQRMLITGGYRRKGLKPNEADKIIDDARELEKAGVFSIVIEYTAADIAEQITKEISIPTICIGSGPHCDGQVLVLYDILGLCENIPPFARKYVDLSKIVVEAVSKFVDEVRRELFPTREHFFLSKGE